MIDQPLGRPGDPVAGPASLQHDPPFVVVVSQPRKCSEGQKRGYAF